MKHLIIIILVLLLVLLFSACSPVSSPEEGEGSAAKIPILFASYAEYPQQVARCLVFCESIRTFAGSMREAPIRVYLSEQADILAFLDANIVVIKEPRDFRLAMETVLAFRPVFHQNIGSLYSEPPDAFWSRVYRILHVPESAIFPMEAVADKSVLRPYINAGYLAVRPERGAAAVPLKNKTTWIELINRL